MVPAIQLLKPVPAIQLLKPMPRKGASDQGGLLTALGAHLELLGDLLKKADACGNNVPQSNVVSMFRKASALIADDPSAKQLASQKLASHDGQKAAKDLKPVRTPHPSKSSTSLASSPRSTSESPLLAAALSGGEEEMLSALGARADPNSVFSDFAVGPRRFVEGTALGIASQRGQLGVMSVLLRHGALPDATYSVTVGRERTTESFPIGFSAVFGENIELVEVLLDARADLHTMTSSLNATMLWEAAYFGKEKMARYVLDRGIDIDAAATSQDNRSWKFTALHAACYKGEIAVAAMLLERSADVEGRNVDGHTPLADAIIKGHGDIVRMLIAARGDLDTATLDRGPAHRLHRSTTHNLALAFMMQFTHHAADPRTPMELLFHSANDHVIAEAARGLQIAPRPIDTLTFIRFLAAKGSAPVEIMKAVSQKQELWYWNEKMERAHVQTAMMKPDSAFIVGHGPHSERLKETFDRKERPTAQVMEFIRDIAPETRALKKRGSGSRRMRGRLMMLDVPNIFFNPEVLQTMIKCEIPEFFELESVQAIVQVHWREVRITGHFQIFFQVFYSGTSMCLNILLLEFERSAFERSAALTAAAWLCVACWLVEVAIELFQMVGFCRVRLFGAVYCTWTSAMDWARLCLSGGVLLYVVLLKADAKNHVWFNCCFGVVMLVRWMRLLYAFRGVKFFGIYLLPITTCLSHVIPFCAVLFPFVLGFTNMYYALDLQNIDDSLVIILQLILLGQVDLNELEGTPMVFGPADGGRGARNPSPDFESASFMVHEVRTDYSAVIRVFMLVCAMVMSTAMMNIFIAVLSEEYHRAYRVRYGIFFRSRAHLAIREYFTWRMARRAAAWVRRRPRQTETEKLSEQHGGNYIWYFKRDDDDTEVELSGKALSRHFQ